MHIPRASYAVTWRDGNGPLRVGRLELGPRGLQLEGGEAGGVAFSATVRYRDLDGVAMSGPGRAMRLFGRPTVVLERRARSLRIASLEGLGTTREIFERIAALLPESTAA